jgi:hypothetical protein
MFNQKVSTRLIYAPGKQENNIDLSLIKSTISENLADGFARSFDRIIFTLCTYSYSIVMYHYTFPRAIIIISVLQV